MFLEKYRLDGKVALITGGTRGIGLSIAHALGEAGAKLVLTNRTNTNGGLDSLKKANYDVSFFEADLHDRSIPQKTIDYTLENHGRVDILVNNAGVAKHGEMEEYNDDFLDGIMNINVDAVFRMCRSVLTPMKKQGEGVILNIGSISGLVSNIPQPQVAYNASKAAVHMMTKSLASDYADQNIRVNAIAPGYIRTDNTQALQDDIERSNEILKRIPANRWGEAEDLQGAAVFLASDASAYVNGHILAVDGGFLAR